MIVRGRTGVAREVSERKEGGKGVGRERGDKSRENKVGIERGEVGGCVGGGGIKTVNSMFSLISGSCM